MFTPKAGYSSGGLNSGRENNKSNASLITTYTKNDSANSVDISAKRNFEEGTVNRSLQKKKVSLNISNTNTNRKGSLPPLLKELNLDNDNSNASETHTDLQSQGKLLCNPTTRSDIANNALASILKIQLDLFAAQKIKRQFDEFLQNPKVIDGLGSDYMVTMGFGLHIGWAIEGALGSPLKTDATYLSPNVNLASRLEAATHQFGCSLLMSEAFVNLLSNNVRSLCRLVDVVIVKGSAVPMKIYTFDIWNLPMKVQDTKVAAKLHSNITKEDLIEVLEALQEGIPQEFVKQQKLAMLNYIKGKWLDAEIQFQKCLNIKKNDGPCTKLLQVIQDSDRRAPKNWKGHRKLTEK